MSIDSQPTKVINTAPSNTTRAYEMANKTAKTGKVAAVVTVMSILHRKKCKLRGVVHAYVHQKLVKNNMFTSFIRCHKAAIESLF
jgi:hypothetical protein